MSNVPLSMIGVNEWKEPYKNIQIKRMETEIFTLKNNGGGGGGGGGGGVCMCLT